MADCKARYKNKYGEEVKQYAPCAYEAVLIFADAMVKAGSAEPAKYLPVLARTDGYKGVIGNVSFDPKGAIKNGSLTLYSLKGATRYQTSVVR